MTDKPCFSFDSWEDVVALADYLSSRKNYDEKAAARAITIILVQANAYEKRQEQLYGKINQGMGKTLNTLHWRDKK